MGSSEAGDYPRSEAELVIHKAKQVGAAGKYSDTIKKARNIAGSSKRINSSSRHHPSSPSMALVMRHDYDNIKQSEEIDFTLSDSDISGVSLNPSSISGRQ